ncbi:MAG TPA: alpha/beta hydrolase [Mycobacterium sp.]|nr:alpha/beta hydrolase [Mycobacterium sp.]
MHGTTDRLVDIPGQPGVQLQVTEAGDPDRPVVVLAHGFPELAYSWRHQIPVLADAGYHVIAPDQRGYGRSSRPERVEDYDIHALTGDLVALLDSVAGARGATAVFVGHDWGATVVWNTALLHPDRVAAVVGLSVPPVPRSKVPPTQAFRRFGDDFYMLRFQTPGVAEAELSADVGATMRALFAEGHAAVPDWIGADDLDHYIAEFTRTGFTGGLNWYRNLDRNWHTTAGLPDRRIAVPALFVAGTSDPVLGFTRTDRADEVVSGPYRQELIDGAGHWIQQDSPAEVNRILLEFLSELPPW